MRIFYIRILSFFYWFYSFETDSWMRLFYSLGALSFLIMSYVSGMMHALGNIYKVDELLIDTLRHPALAFLVLSLNFLYVFSNQRAIEESIKKSLPLKRDFGFYIIVFLILVGIISFFGSLVYFKEYY